MYLSNLQNVNFDDLHFDGDQRLVTGKWICTVLSRTSPVSPKLVMDTPPHIFVNTNFMQP